MDMYYFDHVKLKPDKQIVLHTQESWELSCVVTGCGEREIGDVCQPFKSGDLVLVPPGIPHVWHFSPQCTDAHGCIENITLQFEDAFLVRVSQTFPALVPIVRRIRGYADALVFAPAQKKRIIATLRCMCDESDEERASSVVSLLIQMADAGHYIGHYERKSDLVSRWLMQVRVYVSCNYQRLITLDEMAQHVGMNRSAFCTFFRKHAGQTFMNYLNAYRVNMAQRLLAQERMSVTEACFASGFNDLSYFCRIFRRYKGYPPSKVGTEK